MKKYIKSSDKVNFSSGKRSQRPFVTLSYAQSLDGSIATKNAGRIILSGPDSTVFTHKLRAAHDAILIGIGTVLSDNPKLTVRHTRGRHPRPVIVDTYMRSPLKSYLIQKHPLSPWVAVSKKVAVARRRLLEKTGAVILDIPVSAPGRLDLRKLLRELYIRGVKSLMVEGGQSIITSFLSERLIDYFVITISPVIIDGMPAAGRIKRGYFPSLKNISYNRIGEDVVLRGHPDWSKI